MTDKGNPNQRGKRRVIGIIARQTMKNGTPKERRRRNNKAKGPKKSGRISSASRGSFTIREKDMVQGPGLICKGEKRGYRRKNRRGRAPNVIFWGKQQNYN